MNFQHSTSPPELKMEKPNNKLVQKTILTLIAGIVTFGLFKVINVSEKKISDYIKDKKIENTISFKTKLDNLIHTSKNKHIRKIVSSFKSLDSSQLTDLEKRDLYSNLASLIEEHCESNECDEQTRNLILKYYQHAYELTRLSKDKKTINRKIASILMNNKKWNDAVIMFRDSESYLMSPEERWKTRLDWAECLRNNHEEGKAVALLTQVIEESDVENIWAKAVRQKAEILFEICGSISMLERYKDNNPDQDEITFENTLEQAKDLYEHLISELSSLHKEAFQAQLGLMRLNAHERQYDSVYRIANRLNASSASKDDKIECLTILADMEEVDGNYDAAAGFLQQILNRFSEEHVSAPIFFRLYTLLITQKKWDKAFFVAEKLAAKAKDNTIALSILNDLYPNQNNILNNLILLDDKFNYLSRAQSMVDTLKNVDYPNWLAVEDAADFVTAVLTFHSEKYEEAAELFADYLTQALNSQNFESILYLDVLASKNRQLEPVAVVLKAKRYLYEFTDGNHYEEVLMALLNSYYEMGLYEEALNIAKKSFVKELVNMGKAGEFTSNDQWLSTVAKIGQCYAVLGDYEKTNQIFRTYSKELLTNPQGLTAYMNWINMAKTKGQNYEAIRRYDLVKPNIIDPSEKLAIKTEREMLAMLVNLPRAYENGQQILVEIIEDEVMPPEEKRKLLKRIYEVLLDQAFLNHPEDVDILLENILVQFKNEAWIEYWLLRSLTSKYGNIDIVELKEIHEDILSKIKTNSNDKETTFNFLLTQLDLITSLAGSEERVKKLQERGLNL